MRVGICSSSAVVSCLGGDGGCTPPDIMWPASQSHFHLSFIFIKMNFYLLSFLCDVYNEVHEHMQ